MLFTRLGRRRWSKASLVSSLGSRRPPEEELEEEPEEEEEPSQQELHSLPQFRRG